MGVESPSQPSFLGRILITPGERRLRAGWRVIGHFCLLIILLSCSIIPLAAWMAFIGRTDLTLLAWQALAVFAVTGSVYLARRFLDRRSFTSLGLTWNRTAIRDLLAGFLIAGLMMGFIFLVELSAGWLEFQGFAWNTIPLQEVVLGVLGMLCMFVLVGWHEELLSRGYWLQNLAEASNLFWGVLISSLFFALGHLGNPHVSWSAILGLIISGVFLAYGYLRTRQLWLSIGLHIGWNFFEGNVFGFQVSGLEDLPRMIMQTVQGPELLTGEKFGPEAGLVLLPGLALGTALVIWYTLKREK
jgi:hypothetical protein